MTKLDAFRKLIREEVRKVIREELSAFLTEVPKPQKSSYVDSLKENIKKEVPKRKVNTPAVLSGDPIQQLLAETAYGMDDTEYRNMINADAGMAQGFPAMFAEQREAPASVGSVEDMLAISGPVHDINQVEIDVVPDFSGLMQTLKNKGNI